MRIGVYVDAYNLYYGGRDVCGRGTPGWRWLDVRSLVRNVVELQGAWSGASIERVVYCTARIDAKTNPSAQRDQDVYLKALLGSGSVDHIEYGNYVARTKSALLAVDDKKAPKIFTSAWPVMVRDSSGENVKNAQFMVRYLHMEEKGSDVNVAAHLLIDALGGDIDGAVVVSNDSDLAFPIKKAREIVPVGVVNPRQGYTAGALRGEKGDGVGGHWWWKLRRETFTSNQLAAEVGSVKRPPEW